MTVKFDQKNVAILGKLQAVEGTAVDPIASDALAVIELSADITRETEAYEYKGDSLSREEFTTLKDTYVDMPAQTLMPVLGTLNPSLSAVDAPLYQWLTACNANTTVDTSGAVTFSNDVEVDKLLTIDYFKSSPEVSVSGTAKRQRFTDCRGMLDITFEAGSRATLDFKFMGNDSPPVMVTNIVPDLGSQIEDVASVVRLEFMMNSVIKEILGTETILGITSIAAADGGTTIDFDASHNLAVGETFTVSNTTNFNTDFVVFSVTDTDTVVAIRADSSLLAATFLVSTDGNTLVKPDGVTPIVSTGNTVVAGEASGNATKIKGIPKQMCTNVGNFSNFFGFDYERYLLTCQEGFSKKAVASDVGLTVLEDETGGTDFDPEVNIEKFFEYSLKWGAGVGKYVELFFEKIQLVDSKDTTVGTFFGKELSLRNTGKTKLILS